MLHYWWKVKLDVTNPMIYAAIVAAAARLARGQGRSTSAGRGGTGGPLEPRGILTFLPGPHGPHCRGVEQSGSSLGS